jgi:hypothetical protein
MTKLTILALDPGGTTGWSSFQADEYPNIVDVDESLLPITDGEIYENELWKKGHLQGDHAVELDMLLGLHRTEKYIVVCESFVPRPGKIGAQLDVAQQYIGQVKLFCEKEGVPLKMQMPGQVKPFVKDETIKKLRMWSPGWKHAMDATRHLLFYMVKNTGKRDELLEKGWKFE